MVEQGSVIGVIESMLGEQAHRTIEIEGWRVKTDIKRTAEGFSVEKTYGLEESRRYELDAGGAIKRVLLFDNVEGELTEPEPRTSDNQVLINIIEEALEHA